MSNTFINRISKILLGSSIYWVGYCGFFTQRQNILVSAICMFLLISGLLFAAWNSSNLYRGK